jgi:hypothetical protein
MKRNEIIRILLKAFVYFNDFVKTKQNRYIKQKTFDQF